MAPGTPNPAKMLLRNEVASRIASLSAEEKTRQSRVVYEKVINHPWYKSSKRIALYMSTDQEVDTARLLEHVKQKGAAFVPQYAGGHMKMLRVETGDEAAMDSGSRLGHGGGYYDRFLAKVVALAFNCQMVEKVPVEDTDQKMDDVIAAD
ncbi:hypothetical protein MSG28_008870 [Choristoneura fumiferana]|uniref:Uncharacterized protein n=1 Tax=Choristoneura fumiferana TaxID=7141 RepID=A0ACC0J8A5_CHOFU|nr:hypothetical protein MSG28_008870 [Choristoneura fumiferana]